MELIENRIKQVLHHINREMIDQQSDASLLSGSSGQALFSILYSKHFTENILTEKLSANIQKIVDESLDSRSYSLCSGQAGMSWFFSYLYQGGYIDLEDWEVIQADPAQLAEVALCYLQDGNYDFLHGALGIAYYLLEVQESNAVFFTEFFNTLALLMQAHDNMLPHYDFDAVKLDKTKINLGLAHGLSSVLKFSLECYTKNVCKELAGKTAAQITDFLVLHSNEDKKDSFYPSMHDLDAVGSVMSRLGWCYGDLPIAYVLYESGVVLGEKNTSDFALTIFDHSMRRMIAKDTGVKDAGICHGSAGIAHIYHKMWHKTNLQAFKKSSEYWIGVTLDFASYEDTVSGYKKFDAVSAQYQPSSCLLDGSAGIGLVLISYITNDFSWDYPLMLN